MRKRVSNLKGYGRPFPIQAGEPKRDSDGKMVYPESSTIPWWLAEKAYKSYSKHHSQSLEEIASRGGFGRDELLQLLSNN